MNSEKNQITLKATTHITAPDMKIERELPEGARAESMAEFAAIINSVIDPPERLTADDILVRSLLLVSSETNHYGGKFGEEELRRIAELVVDSPVLVGHRKDTLPIARVFQADVITYQGAIWVRAHFYWLKSASGSDTLATNIDGGLYKECSLGFSFMRAECSECGSDIRHCAHRPGSDPDNNRGGYNYRDIQRVLEISLVYRGATPNTRVGATLGFAEFAIDADEIGAEESDAKLFDFVPDIKLKRLSVLTGREVSELTAEVALSHCRSSESAMNGVIIASADLQDDLPLLVGRSAGDLFVLRDDGVEAPDQLASAVLDLGDYPEQDFLLYGRLVGMRGKQRRSLSELAKRLNSSSGPVRSFKLRAVALLYWDGSWSGADCAEALQDKLEGICKDSDRISFSSHRSVSSELKRSRCELVIAVGPGEFHFLRVQDNPGTLCRSVADGASTQTLSICGAAGESREQSFNQDGAKVARSSNIVSLKFDHVIKQRSGLRLVNSRINAQLGELCGVEEYKFANPSEETKRIITRDSTIRLGGSSEPLQCVAPISSEALTTGLCHVLTPKADESFAVSNTVNMSIGDVARFQAAPGENISVRMIELLCGEKRVLALLSEHRSA